MSEYFVSRRECSRFTPFDGVTMHTMTAQSMTLSLVEMEPGAVIEEHSHPHEQIGMLLEGEARFRIGDQERVLRAGDMYRIPGGVPHRVAALDAGAKALDTFHPVREDYR